MTVATAEISQSVQRALDDLLGFIPTLLGFVVLLLIGFAKALHKVVALALEKAGAERALRSRAGARGEVVNRPPGSGLCRSPSAESCSRSG